MEQRVSNRAINRSYLARQLLLERADIPVEAAIEHLVGLQAQDVMPPYVTLWTRLRQFGPEDLAGLLERREAVRLTLMRGTVHLVSRRDALRIRPLVQPEVRKAVTGAGPRKEATAGIELDELADIATTVLAAEGATMSRMIETVASQWPDRDARLLAQSAIWLVAATQVPPRGLWKRNDRPRWAMLDRFLGAPLEDDYLAEALIVRYLKAFGPATLADMQAWSRLTGLRAAIERIRGELRVLHDEQGREMFDVEDAPWPDADTPAPVRFLGAFDNLLLAHQDRERIIDRVYWPQVMSSNGVGRPSILIDGKVTARYRIASSNGASCLTILPFRTLTPAESDEALAEGGRLLQFLEPNQDHRIEIDPPVV